jgi:hypothetical protein
MKARTRTTAKGLRAGLTAATLACGLARAAPVPIEPAQVTVECQGPSHPINELIYGIGAYYPDRSAHQWEMGATARRWGGDAATRFNWRLGNAWNSNHNWYFRNVKVVDAPSFSYDTFFEENREHGVSTVLTVPMLGWVAKDTTSYSFPVRIFGPQQSIAFDNPESGNGISPSGSPLTPLPPTQTSVPFTPDDLQAWVRAIREKDAGRGRSVQMYILDNEPMNWNKTHRDIHPEPATYDEVLEKTIAYGTAIRRADPDAVIAGPAEWGWLAYHFSARDTSRGKLGKLLRWDRLKHGNVPFVPWYLRKLRDHESRTGVRVLDVLDVHFYPASPGMGTSIQGMTDPETAAKRIRMTRSLWDPNYQDESWIKEKMRVLPLLKEWVAENYPGRGISIGEWSFGAENHMSGGLAVAEVLGRFGVQGLTSAFYWFYPPAGSPAFWAFRAYRNFDGKGSRFLDVSIPATSRAADTSVFASRDASGRRAVVILLNSSPDLARQSTVALTGCRPPSTVRAFRYAQGDAAIRPADAAISADAITLELPAYSISVLDVNLRE